MVIDKVNITLMSKNHGVRSSAPETKQNVTDQAAEETSGSADKVSITEKARDYMLNKFDIADSEALQNGSDKARKLGLIKNLIRESTGEKIKLKDIFDQVRNMEPESENPVEDVPEDVVGDVVGDVPADVAEDVPEDVVGDVVADVPADVTEDVPADVVENVVEEATVADPGV